MKTQTEPSETKVESKLRVQITKQDLMLIDGFAEIISDPFIFMMSKDLSHAVLQQRIAIIKVIETLRSFADETKSMTVTDAVSNLRDTLSAYYKIGTDRAFESANLIYAVSSTSFFGDELKSALKATHQLISVVSEIVNPRHKDEEAVAHVLKQLVGVDGSVAPSAVDYVHEMMNTPFLAAVLTSIHSSMPPELEIQACGMDTECVFENNESPDFFGVYVRIQGGDEDDNHAYAQHIQDFKTHLEAVRFAGMMKANLPNPDVVVINDKYHQHMIREEMSRSGKRLR